MFKYIFCLIAILMQPIFAFLVFHKQEKQKAALKMPLVYLSGVYLVIQIFVFFKVCLKIPKDYQVYSYLLQGVILAVFIIIEIAMAASNKYITKDMKKELDALRVKTELMLDFEEEEFENFSALHCNNCGAELASGTKFCPKCGTKVEEAQKMFCPQCGNEIMPGAKFCTKCGARCM